MKIKKLITFIFCSKYLSPVLYSCGNGFLKFSGNTGRLCIFVYNLFLNLFTRQYYWHNIRYCFINIGFCSIPIVALAGFFTGAVLTIQLYHTISKFGLEYTIPSITFVAMFKELGPVLTGLMLVSRVGSSMTAEISSMIIKNQIDTLITLSINPFRFIYIPRIIVTTLVTPLLTILSGVIGILGGYIAMVYYFDFSYYNYLDLLRNAFDYSTIIIGLIKSTVFGIGISMISCYIGSTTDNGSFGVGESTVASVIVSCIYILFFNLIIAFIMQ